MTEHIQKFKIGDLVRVIGGTIPPTPDSKILGVRLSSCETYLMYQVGGHNYKDDQIELIPPNLALWLLVQGERNGYDTYDSCVVCAHTENEARNITPSTYRPFDSSDWASSADNVIAVFLGFADDKTLTTGTVICSSFNAG